VVVVRRVALCATLCLGFCQDRIWDILLSLVISGSECWSHQQHVGPCDAGPAKQQHMPEDMMGEGLGGGPV
jgi:hypothetical protein